MDKIIRMIISTDYKNLEGNSGKKLGNSSARP